MLQQQRVPLHLQTLPCSWEHWRGRSTRMASGATTLYAQRWLAGWLYHRSQAPFKRPHSPLPSPHSHHRLLPLVTLPLLLLLLLPHPALPPPLVVAE